MFGSLAARVRCFHLELEECGRFGLMVEYDKL
jgi:hypothetical protein